VLSKEKPRFGGASQADAAFEIGHPFGLAAIAEKSGAKARLERNQRSSIQHGFDFVAKVPAHVTGNLVVIHDALEQSLHFSEHAPWLVQPVFTAGV